MIYIFIILICTGLCILGAIQLSKAKKIKIQKNQLQQQYDLKVKQLQQQQTVLTNQCLDLTNKAKILADSIADRKLQINHEYDRQRNRIEEQMQIYKVNVQTASEQYVANLQQQYKQAEKEYDKQIQQKQDQLKDTNDELQKLKESLSAGVAAQLRQKEKEEQIEFYKLKLSDKDLEDVIALERIKPSLHQPVILSKLVWSQYFQKQTTEMCNRILGNKIVCGIYKITNLTTQQCYIGQSVDIATRWKSHIKCGLGIDAPATNKLYKSMQSTGVWHFSFELMEECPRDQLDQKEKFWINLYQTNLYGYNSTKGNN